MTILYDASELGTISTMLVYRGSMVAMVVQSPIFWILIAFHAALLLIDRGFCGDGDTCNLSSGDNLTPMNWNGRGPITALSSFFLVFYGSNSYKRMQLLWGHCVGMGGSCMNWVCLVRNNLPPDKRLQWNCTRLVLATMHIQYYSLNEAKGGGESISADEWDLMVERHLLDREEVEVVRSYLGYKPFLPLVWAIEEVEAAILGPEMVHVEDIRLQQRCRAPDLLEEFRRIAFGFRFHCSQITQWLNMPTPFPYYHGLNFVLLSDMLILSWALVSLKFHAVLTAITYAVIITAFLGLKEVAVAMSDPFGDDDVDFDTEKLLAGERIG